MIGPSGRSRALPRHRVCCRRKEIAHARSFLLILDLSSSLLRAGMRGFRLNLLLALAHLELHHIWRFPFPVLLPITVEPHLPHTR